jgi:hypothetical protein
LETTYNILRVAVSFYPNNTDLAYIVYDVGLQTRSFGTAREILENMKAGLGEMLTPYIDSLSMYEQYLGKEPAPPEGVK